MHLQQCQQQTSFFFSTFRFSIFFSTVLTLRIQCGITSPFIYLTTIYINIISVNGTFIIYQKVLQELAYGPVKIEYEF